MMRLSKSLVYARVFPLGEGFDYYGAGRLGLF